jgi:hypothetical protein
MAAMTADGRAKATGPRRSRRGNGARRWRPTRRAGSAWRRSAASTGCGRARSASSGGSSPRRGRRRRGEPRRALPLGGLTAGMLSPWIVPNHRQFFDRQRAEQGLVERRGYGLNDDLVSPAESTVRQKAQTVRPAGSGPQISRCPRTRQMRSLAGWVTPPQASGACRRAWNHSRFSSRPRRESVPRPLPIFFSAMVLPPATGNLWRAVRRGQRPG